MTVHPNTATQDFPSPPSGRRREPLPGPALVAGAMSFGFAPVHLVSALMVYGKLPGPSWSGAAPLVGPGGLPRRGADGGALPVCPRLSDVRAAVLWHSLLGGFFFGVFSAKMLLLRSERLSLRLLPIVGGLVFTALTVVRLTSALWFFRTFGVTT